MLALNGHRLPVFRARLEAPGFDTVNCAGIQTRIERFGDLDVMRSLIGTHYNC